MNDELRTANPNDERRTANAERTEGKGIVELTGTVDFDSADDIALADRMNNGRSPW